MNQSIEDILADIDDCIAKRGADLAPVKGMHVPYHGTFCSAAPSVIKDLEQFAKKLRAALEENK
jgi:hypothetical protein